MSCLFIRKRIALFASFLLSSAIVGIFSQSAFAQEGKYASFDDAALDITYSHVYPISMGQNSEFGGAAANAPNFYGGDLGHATSATCGMTFLMKPGYKVIPSDDSSSISYDNCSIVDAAHGQHVDDCRNSVDEFIRATWVIITYKDGSADLVMFGNTHGRSFGPTGAECTDLSSNSVNCGYKGWAFSCDDVFSDEITIADYTDSTNVSWTFPVGSTTNFESIRNWRPSNPSGYDCPTSHFDGSFESHYRCTLVHDGYADTLTDEQKKAAAAAITYNQQTQEDQCGGIIGFFTCPLAESMSNFLKTVYDVFSGFFLNIGPEVFNGNKQGTSGYAIHKAWNSFRNIANIMIVAALLIVILSQISGIGISNYGIKKSLPKIVIAALLVNLSYIICQGAIDISNIFGHRIGDIFEQMLANSGGPISSSTYTGSNIATLIFILIGVIVAIIKFGSKIWVALILLLLVAAVAMFIMLAVSVIRQALCILLVVVSPVALCCYMIPGTKSIFNRWFGMFKGVLVAYPMTTLVVYGSSYASSVLLKAWGFSSSGISAFHGSNFLATFFHSIAGLLIVVVPYFFIPKIIMKSLGALNGMMTGIGNAMIKNTKGAVRGSAFAQRQNDKQEFRKNLRGAGLHYNKKTGAVENRRKTGGKGVVGAFRRARNAFYSMPSRQMYARNANSMAAQRRRGRSYYSGGNELDEILRDYNGDSAELKQKKAELRKKLEFYRRTGRSTEGIKRQVNKMFGQGGKFEAFAPSKFRDASGVFTGVRGDFETTADNISKSADSQRTRDYIKQIEATSGLTEDNLSDGAINAATAGNKELTSAYVTVLLGSGEAGREALLECIKTNGLSDEVLATIAKSVSTAEMNDIKKKDPYLYKRLKALQDGNGISAGSMNIDNNFKMECKDIRGMSAKQFSEMDASAQNRLIDEITDPNIYGSGTGYNPEDGIVAAAVNLAEEILSDNNLRASISPEKLSNLENIVRIRDDAVQKSVQSNRSADLSAISGVSSVGTDFVTGIMSSSLANEYLEAAKNGDSIRMESIQQNIESKYRENLRNAGINLTEDANTMILTVMQDVYTQLNGAVDSKNLTVNNFNGADDAAKKRHADARDGFVDLLSGRMDRRRRSFKRQ